MPLPEKLRLKPGNHTTGCCAQVRRSFQVDRAWFVKGNSRPTSGWSVSFFFFVACETRMSATQREVEILHAATLVPGPVICLHVTVN